MKSVGLKSLITSLNDCSGFMDKCNQHTKNGVVGFQSRSPISLRPFKSPLKIRSDDFWRSAYSSGARVGISKYEKPKVKNSINRPHLLDIRLPAFPQLSQIGILAVGRGINNPIEVLDCRIRHVPWMNPKYQLI
ncbi:hypothetical protein M3Y94_00157500 [Aphelenchoides besseyi]|nr:hypothetical protein M3Y94_00157500 [Aphelenchoides besseyi]